MLGALKAEPEARVGYRLLIWKLFSRGSRENKIGQEKTPQQFLSWALRYTNGAPSLWGTSRDSQNAPPKCPSQSRRPGCLSTDPFRTVDDCPGCMDSLPHKLRALLAFAEQRPGSPGGGAL